ncbi:glycerophosphodiester phosphodiesterase [soil metagenome]
MSPRGIEIIGHAGAAGFHPHNSLASLEKALDLGVDRIEIDVLSTREDTLMLVHDTKVFFNKRRVPVSGLSLREVRVSIPGALTLDDAHKLTSGRIPLLIDIKGRHYVQSLASSISEISASDHVSASSTHARVLKQLHRMFPAMTLGLSRGHSLTRIRNRFLRGLIGRLVSVVMIVPTLVIAKWCGSRELMIQHHTCTLALVRVAQVLGYKVNAWTVDNPEDMQRMIRIGVDGIISNRPDLVLEELAHAV